MKGAFDKEGKVLKQDIFTQLTQYGRENNKKKNFPLTIVKIVDYEEDNETVNRERIQLVFHDTVSEEFKDAIFNTISEILDFLYEGSSDYKRKISRDESFIEFWGVGTQISRKKTAPLIEPVVAAFNQYFYSSIPKSR